VQLINSSAYVCFCLLDAPGEEAVIKHHNKVGINCEWITRVTMATGKEFFSPDLASGSRG